MPNVNPLGGIRFGSLDSTEKQDREVQLRKRGKESAMELDVTSDEGIEGLTIEFQREISDVNGDAKLLPDRRRILLPTLETGRQIHIGIHFHNGQ